MPDNNALHIAAQGRGDLVQVQCQVNNFDINAKGEEDGTALYWSARDGNADIVKLLLTFNPDVNIPDVSTIKMISVHLLMYVIPIPYFLHHSIYCYHCYPPSLPTSNTICIHSQPFILLPTFFFPAGVWRYSLDGCVG